MLPEVIWIGHRLKTPRLLVVVLLAFCFFVYMGTDGDSDNGNNDIDYAADLREWRPLAEAMAHSFLTNQNVFIR